VLRNKHQEGIVDFIVRQKPELWLHDNFMIKADKGHDIHNYMNKHQEGIVDFIVRQNQNYWFHDNFMFDAD